jgi:glucose-6-phosphate-specific signal transduction histidine kinase
MGLVSMRERVERLGGILRVDSQEGQGTRISVSLQLPPYTPGTRETLRRATPEPAASPDG